MPIILSTNERELYLTDPLFHRLVDNLVALAIEHQAYRAEDGRRLTEAVNAARAILEGTAAAAGPNGRLHGQASGS